MAKGRTIKIFRGCSFFEYIGVFSSFEIITNYYNKKKIY